jgi:hypothetical protein
MVMEFMCRKGTTAQKPKKFTNIDMMKNKILLSRVYSGVLFLGKVWFLKNPMLLKRIMDSLVDVIDRVLPKYSSYQWGIKQ